MQMYNGLKLYRIYVHVKDLVSTSKETHIEKRRTFII